MSESKTVRLGELAHDPISIAGHEGRLVKIDDLLASLTALGQLQSLKVRPAGQGAPEGVLYWVTAGNRRLATLMTLAAKGEAIKSQKVTFDFPVHVVFSNQSDEDAHQAMVAENVQRLAPTPMEEARDFAEMVKVASVKEIAGRFGVSKKYVEQRLRLATLHPDVQAALIAGDIDLAAAQAFTVEPDPDRQAAYLAECRSTKRQHLLSEHNVRRAFTDVLVASDSETAKLIGKEPYKAAGGEIVSDVFGDSGPAFWVSHNVIRKLLDDHWEARRAEWLADGWAWVAGATEYPHTDYGQMHHANVTFERADADGAFTPEQKARCGVVYWQAGDYQPKFGVIDAAKVAQPAVESTKAETKKPAPSLNDPGNSVIQNLTERLTAAAQVKLAGAPELALQLLVATLHCQVFHPRSMYEGPLPLQVTALRASPQATFERTDAGKTLATAIAWAALQPVPTLLVYLAELVAPSVQLRQPHSLDGDANLKSAVADFIDPPIGSHFDPADYFSSITKPLIALAHKESTGDALAEGKKGDMAAIGAVAAKETGWLPPQLRMPSYAGPAKPNPLAAKPKKGKAAAANEDETPRVAAE